MRSLSLDQLRAFVAVVESGGFTTAARQLNLSQPAAAEGFDAVSAGTVEMNYANSYFWTGKSFAAQYFCAVPFGLNFQGFNGWYYDGGRFPAVARGL